MANGNDQEVTQVAVNSLPFWSRIVQRFDLRWDGTNDRRNVITRGTKIRAFGYRQNGSNENALAGEMATERDTVVQEGGKTLGGARYIIHGLSIGVDGKPYDLGPDGEHRVWPGMSQLPGNGGAGPQCPSLEDERSLLSTLASVFAQCFKVDIRIDGVRRTLEMGVPQFYPGQGGIKDSVASNNGDVFVSNYMPIPEAIVWNPSGAVDSNLVVQLEAAYTMTLPTWTTPYGTASGLPPDADHPVLEGAVPTALGRDWRQGFIVNFHGRAESPVSNVS